MDKVTDMDTDKDWDMEWIRTWIQTQIGHEYGQDLEYGHVHKTEEVLLRIHTGNSPPSAVSITYNVSWPQVHMAIYTYSTTF